MYGNSCPECGYSSHDQNATAYHNNCLQIVQARAIKSVFVLAFVIGFAIAFVLGRVVKYVG